MELKLYEYHKWKILLPVYGISSDSSIRFYRSIQLVTIMDFYILIFVMYAGIILQIIVLLLFV